MIRWWATAHDGLLQINKCIYTEMCCLPQVFPGLVSCLPHTVAMGSQMTQQSWFSSSSSMSMLLFL